MMLDDIGQIKTAKTIRTALDQVFSKKQALTPDLGGQASTKEFVSLSYPEIGRAHYLLWL